MLVALHKPYGVLSRFTSDGSKHATLAGLSLPKGVYPIGRLDADSEGLLLLTDEPQLVARLLDPRFAHPREYLVQVEREIDDAALSALEAGVVVLGRRSRPARARRIEAPDLPPRDPPVRFRKSVPTSWIALELTEGKNRQVRRMTAAVGFPTLRLYRARIGRFTMSGLAAGEWRILAPDERAAVQAHDESTPREPRRARAEASARRGRDDETTARRGRDDETTARRGPDETTARRGRDDETTARRGPDERRARERASKEDHRGAKASRADERRGRGHDVGRPRRGGAPR